MNPSEYYFPVFKGLQKPLEFMGLRGRFIKLAAMGAGFSFLGFVVGALCFSQYIGMGIMAALVIISYVSLILKQKQGLHNKHRDKDILIYHYLFIRK